MTITVVETSPSRPRVTVLESNKVIEVISPPVYNTVEVNNLALAAPEVNDLTASVIWADVPDDNITESSVTQHESALTITESQISDLKEYLTVANAVASNISIDSYGTITSSNVQNALEQLASQKFVSTSTNPPSENVEVGDFWYQTDTHSLFVYRELSPGSLEWVPIMIGNDSVDSDTIDAGAF